MKTKAGLWIDHRKAIIVTLSNKREKTQQILSNIEKQLGRFEGIRSTVSFESQMVQADDRQERGFTEHLKGYYEKVLATLCDAESVLLLGPGEAKGELIKLMEHNNHGDRVVVMESADKMTDRQIVAKVRHHFANQIMKG
jgi:hypothetical protein